MTICWQFHCTRIYFDSPIFYPLYFLFQPRIKCSELRTKKKEDLVKQLEDLKTELGSLKVAKVTGGAASKLSKIRVVTKSIARVHIVMNQKQKDNLRKFYRVSYSPFKLTFSKVKKWIFIFEMRQSTSDLLTRDNSMCAIREISSQTKYLQFACKKVKFDWEIIVLKFFDWSGLEEACRMMKKFQKHWS